MSDVSEGRELPERSENVRKTHQLLFGRAPSYGKMMTHEHIEHVSAVKFVMHIQGGTAMTMKWSTGLRCVSVDRRRTNKSTRKSTGDANRLSIVLSSYEGSFNFCFCMFLMCFLLSTHLLLLGLRGVRGPSCTKQCFRWC